jgi:hypothetical protein
MDQLTIKTPNLKGRLFLKMAYKGIWQHVFICLNPPPFCLGVEKQFCGFGIWSNTHCRCSPVSSQHVLIHTAVLILIGRGGGGGGQSVRRLEGR